MEKVLLVETPRRRQSSSCPPDCWASKSWTGPKSKPFFPRQGFSTAAEPAFQEARHAARQDDRQPVLRSLDAHAHQLRDRRQAPGRRRGFDHGVRLQRLQGRIAGGHAEHAGGHAAGRDRDAARGVGRAAFSGALPADSHHQRRRRHPRASHAGAARCAHHSRPPAALEGLRVAIIGDIAHSRVARSNVHLLSKFGADIVLCGPAPLLPPELACIATGVTLTHDIREAIRRRRRHHDAARATGAPARTAVRRKRIFPVLRAAPGAHGAGQAGRHRHAPRPHQPRARAIQRSGRFPALRDSESGGKWRGRAHGGAGTRDRGDLHVRAAH